MDSVKIRGAFLPVSPEEREEGIIRFKVDQRYRNLLHAYGVEHMDELGDQELTVEPYTFNYTERAFNFFHQVRDMILLEMSGPEAVMTKSEKDDLKRQLKQEFGPRDKDSLKEYDRYELWVICQGAVRWLQEAGGSLAGLRTDFEELKNENTESI